MSPFRIDRRKVLRGAAGLAVALPLLEAMTRPRRAHAQARPPKRFMTFFNPHGTVMANWKPSGSETGFVLPRILEPLEPFRNELVVLGGVDNKTALGPEDAHTRGTGSLFTGVPIKIYGGKPLASGISVDQAIANNIGKETRFKSIELSVLNDQAGNAVGHLSYTGPGMALPAEGDPAKAFARLFSGPVGGEPATPVDMTAFNKLWAERRAVLDAVREEHQALAPRLGANDRAKLDQHLTAIRDVEKRLSATGGGAAAAGAACRKPTLVTVDPLQAVNMPTLIKLQFDILAMAFACDLTRVASLQIERGRGQVVHSWLGSKVGHHELSHRSDPEQRELMTRIGGFYAQALAAFLKTLASVPEGNGTLLDNFLLAWGSDVSNGDAHSLTDIPLLLVGRAGGGLRTGRFLVYKGEPHNNLLVSLLNIFGNPVTTFGNPATCTGPLANLV